MQAFKPSRTGGLLNRLTWVGSFLLVIFCVAVVASWVNSGNRTSTARPVVQARAASDVAPKRILIPTSTPRPPTRTPAPTRADVTLRAAPGNTKVQMFDVLRDGPNVNVTTFNDGYSCSKVGDRVRFGEGDLAMYFYKLNCGGKIGYVNVKWVR